MNGRPPIFEKRMNSWIHLRVTEEQARRVSELGGYKFLREVLDEKLQEHRPRRLEDVWRKGQIE